MTTRSASVRCAPVIALVVAVVTTLAGCTAPAEQATSAPPSAPATDAGPATAPAPALVPDGTAEQNLPYFEQVVRDSVGADPETPGLTVVDALVTAGFSRETMQLTADETSVGLEADSVQVSVKLSDQCLVGQWGPKSDGPRAVVVAPIATGACLIGRTVPLDG